MFGELNTHAGGWTDERVERMKKMWLVDGFSASQIASVLGEGVTRNGVLGKLHRLKVLSRPSKALVPTGKVAGTAPAGKRGYAGHPGQGKSNAIRRSAVTRQRDVAREKNRLAVEAKKLIVPSDVPEFEASPIPAGAVWQPLDGRLPVPLVDLGNHDCRWPLGDPREAGFGYCGLPHGEGTSYCERHQARSIGRGGVHA